MSRDLYKKYGTLTVVDAANMKNGREQESRWEQACGIRWRTTVKYTAPVLLCIWLFLNIVYTSSPYPWLYPLFGPPKKLEKHTGILNVSWCCGLVLYICKFSHAELCQRFSTKYISKRGFNWDCMANFSSNASNFNSSANANLGSCITVRLLYFESETNLFL